ncbi:MAG: hypothetical protein HY043_21485 [Verrucomicrobia bacterium]|nr:hypothetical protein [Verrucomicrobiota bacterium]
MNDNNSEFYRIAGVSLAGLTELGVALGITHTTVPQLTGLMATAENGSALFQTTRAGKRQAFIDLRTARANAQDYIEKARNYLTPFLGGTWNESWTQIGFTSPTLELPNTDARRLRVLTGITAYFTANAAHESTPLNITASTTQGLLDALTAAMQTTRNCRTDQRTNRDGRNTAETALENQLNSLWKELEAVLTPTDARWLKFIDRIPGDPHAPEQVTDVTATVQPGGIIVLDWPDATRASRYKVLKQIVGVDPAPVVVATVEDSDAQITGVPSGATVQLQIVATNGVGDAPASDVIQLQAA